MPAIVLDVDTSVLWSAASVAIIPATTLSLSVWPLNHQLCIPGPGCWKIGYLSTPFWGPQVLKGQWLLLFLYKALFLTFVRLLTTGSSDTAGDVKLAPTLPVTLVFFFFPLLPLSTLRILYMITGRKTISMFISQPQLLLLLFYLMNPFTIRSCEWGVFHLFVFPVYLWQLPWCQSSESLSQWVKQGTHMRKWKIYAVYYLMLFIFLMYHIFSRKGFMAAFIYLDKLK